MQTPVDQLHQLFHDEWEARLQFDPLFATYTGDHRYNDRLPRTREEDFAAYRRDLAGFRRQLEGIERSALPPAEQLNYDIWQRLIDNELRELELGGHRLTLSKMWGFHIAFADCYLTMPFDNAEDYEKYIARLNAFPVSVQDQIELMRTAMQLDFIPPRVTLEGVDEALRAQLVSDAVDSVLYKPFLSFPATLDEAQRAGLHVELARQRSNELQALMIEGEYKYVEMASLRLLKQVEAARLYLEQAEGLSQTHRQALGQDLNQTILMQALVLKALVNTTPYESQPMVRHVLLAFH